MVDDLWLKMKRSSRDAGVAYFHGPLRLADREETGTIVNIEVASNLKDNKIQCCRTYHFFAAERVAETIERDISHRRLSSCLCTN